MELGVVKWAHLTRRVFAQGEGGFHVSVRGRENSGFVLHHIKTGPDFLSQLVRKIKRLSPLKRETREGAPGSLFSKQLEGGEEGWGEELCA